MAPPRANKRLVMLLQPGHRQHLASAASQVVPLSAEKPAGDLGKDAAKHRAIELTVALLMQEVSTFNHARESRGDKQEALSRNGNCVGLEPGDLGPSSSLSICPPCDLERGLTTSKPLSSVRKMGMLPPPQQRVVRRKECGTRKVVGTQRSRLAVCVPRLAREENPAAQLFVCPTVVGSIVFPQTPVLESYPLGPPCVTVLGDGAFEEAVKEVWTHTEGQREKTATCPPRTEASEETSAADTLIADS